MSKVFRKHSSLLANGRIPFVQIHTYVVALLPKNKEQQIDWQQNNTVQNGTSVTIYPDDETDTQRETNNSGQRTRAEPETDREFLPIDGDGDDAAEVAEEMDWRGYYGAKRWRLYRSVDEQVGRQ